MPDGNLGAGQKRIRKLVAPPSEQMRKKRAETIGAKIKAGGGVSDTLLVFPEDLASHYMVMHFYRYNFKEDVADGMKLQQTIFLPVPLNLVEQINTRYNEASSGAIGGEISENIAQGIESEIANKTKDVKEGAMNFIGSVKDAITGEGTVRSAITSPEAGIATMGFRTGDGAIAAGLNRFFGSAPNPHITALFQGVGLRTHNFTWKLAPQSRDESDKLAEIVNSFRASMLPERGVGNLTLRYPDEVDISIMGTQTPYMIHFKRAVIRNMGVNYAPDGVLSFFGDERGAPTAIQITLDLMETSIHTREDYEDGINFVGADQDDSSDSIKGIVDEDVKRREAAERAAMNKQGPF